MTENNNQKNITEDKPVPNKFVQVENYLKRKYDFRYNTVLNFYEYKEKEEEQYIKLEIEKIYAHLCRINLELSERKLIAMFKSEISERYNPLMKYFQELTPWDGKDHIKALCTFIKTTDDVRFELQLKKQLVRCAKNIFIDGYFNKHCFVLMSRNTETNKAQSMGKTSIISWLVPPALRESYYTLDFNPENDAKCNRSLSECFIINIDEMANLNRSDLDKVKRYLSQSSARERLPYDRDFSTLKRNASFFGSTNKDTFLNDPSGSVRWLVFELCGIDFGYSKHLIPDQIWAQAYAMFQTNYAAELSAEELEANEQSNNQFKERSSEMDLIEMYFEKDRDKITFLTPTEVQLKLYEKNNNPLSAKLTANNIGKALSSLGYVRTSVRAENGIPRYGYYIKALTPFN